ESVNTELDNIEGQIAVIEDEIFRGREQNMVIIISQTRRKIIDFLRTLEPMQGLFKELLISGPSLLGKEARPYLEYLSESHAKLVNVLITQKETIAALEETNQSLLSTKTNATLRLLTVFTAIMLAPNTIAQIFATNISNIPFSHSANGFLIVTSVIFISGLFTFLFFKFKRWI
ncbi:MAG TPA: CorA family divalent cation transporter, partial [Candidatus Paceibacterota bacterium]